MWGDRTGSGRGGTQTKQASKAISRKFRVFDAICSCQVVLGTIFLELQRFTLLPTFLLHCTNI